MFFVFFHSVITGLFYKIPLFRLKGYIRHLPRNLIPHNFITKKVRPSSTPVSSEFSKISLHVAAGEQYEPNVPDNIKYIAFSVFHAAYRLRLKQTAVLCPWLAVYAAVYAIFFVRKFKCLCKPLLGRGYAPRIFAAHNIAYGLRKLKMSFIYKLAVFYNVNRYAGVYIA